MYYKLKRKNCQVPPAGAYSLQKGKVVYKMGISFTKQDFRLQNGILELQTGLSVCYLPSESEIRIICIDIVYHIIVC